MKKVILSILGFLFLFSQSAFAAGDAPIVISSPIELTIKQVYTSQGAWIYSGDKIAEVKTKDGKIIHLKAGISGQVQALNIARYDTIGKNEIIAVIIPARIVAEQAEVGADHELPKISELFEKLYLTTGIAAIMEMNSKDWTAGWGRLMMGAVGCLILYLGISKNFEPLLLVPIGFGAVLANIPLAGIAEPGGILYYIYEAGITTGIFPLIIFMGVGAMTDFGPMIANPKTILLGGAAQLGIFTTLLGALALNAVPGIEFSLKDAAAIGIIGGADGPTAIFLASQLSPRLLGSIAVAAYSYMALVPIIQPPIMRALTTLEEKNIQMVQLRHVSRREKILLPYLVIGICAILLPSAAPLIGMFMFGNLIKESGVVDRLSDTIQNALINIVTIFLGLGVGSKLSADKFLNLETLGILSLGMVAFCVGTAGGIMMAKLMNKFSTVKINPLIGAAGVSAVPMAARVANKVGLEYNSHNHLLMHAMGANVSGVIGSAVAAGVLLALL